MSGLVNSIPMRRYHAAGRVYQSAQKPHAPLSNTALSWSGAGVWLPARQFPLPSSVEGMCFPRALWCSGPGLGGTETGLEPHRTSMGSPLPKGTE